MRLRIAFAWLVASLSTIVLVTFAIAASVEPDGAISDDLTPEALEFSSRSTVPAAPAPVTSAGPGLTIIFESPVTSTTGAAPAGPPLRRPAELTIASTTTTTSTATTTTKPAPTTTKPPKSTTTTKAPKPTTTTSPPPTTTTRPPPTTTQPPTSEWSPKWPADPGGTRDVEYWRSLVKKHWPDDRVDCVLGIIKKESRGDPRARNTTHDTRGLMQHLLKYWSGRARGAGFVDGNGLVADPYNGEANIAAGAYLANYYDEQGKDWWQPWGGLPSYGSCSG